MIGPALSHDAFILAVGFSPDGKLFVSGGGDDIAGIWRMPAAAKGRPDEIRRSLREVVGFDGQRGKSRENRRSAAGVYSIYSDALSSFRAKNFDKAYGELARAKQLLEQAVQSAPDRDDYYNLACLNSLLAETESQRGGTAEAVSRFVQASVDAFQKAIKLGYANLEHANADSDLNFVRQMPEFIKVLQNTPAHKE
jgi:hypothetical protein